MKYKFPKIYCVIYTYNKYDEYYLIIYIFQRDDDAPRAVKFTMRERRFIKFASVDVHGQIYMTPRDFLDSVVESEPRRKLTN